jgi:fibro-slime domain-containing protein
MERSSKLKWITDRRIQGVCLLLIAAVGLRQATLAQDGSAGNTASVNSYPLVGVVRDFSPIHRDFSTRIGDSLVASVGNVAARLDGDGRPVFSGGGRVLTTAARDASGRPIMPSSVRAGPVTNFSINGASVSSTQPMVAKVTLVGAAFSNGTTLFPVAMRVRVGTQLHEPFGPFNNSRTGNINDNRNPRTFVVPGTIAAGTAISIDGQSWLRDLTRPNMTVNSSSGGAQVKALRHGDTVPNIAGFGTQASALQMLGQYLDSTGKKVRLNPNQVIYLFELATTDTRAEAFDMQDLVVVIDLASDPTYFQTPAPPAFTDICGTIINDTPAVLGAADSGGISSAASFSQWFRDIPGQNVSARTFLSMTRDNNGVFSFATPDFTPVDGEMYGNQGASHNRGFSLAIDATSRYTKCTGQFLEYAGSGDAWLFVNGTLTLDLGGTHPGARQIVMLDRLNLVDGTDARIQLFYAQRTSGNAAFSLRTNMILSTPLSVGAPAVSGLSD